MLSEQYSEKDREEQLAECYHLMHQNNQYCGTSWQQDNEKLVKKLNELLPNISEIRTLDFGCGKIGGLSNLYENVTPFDPYVMQFSSNPWDKEFDCIFSADVLEHLTKKQAESLFLKVENNNFRHAFFHISCRKANKILADGTNAHETVETPEWWKDMIKNTMSSFDLIYSEDLVTRKYGREGVTLFYTRR